MLLASANMSAMILYIITNAVLFSFLMTSEQIPQAMTAWIKGSGIDWVEFLLVVNVLLLLAGNVMEPSSIVLITAPILFPIAVSLGINPIHLVPDDGEHGSRALPPAGRPQSLCCLRYRAHGHYRAHHSDLAVAGNNADLSCNGDLHSGTIVVAAAHARDVVNAQKMNVRK